MTSKSCRLLARQMKGDTPFELVKSSGTLPGHSLSADMPAQTSQQLVRVFADPAVQEPQHLRTLASHPAHMRRSTYPSLDLAVVLRKPLAPQCLQREVFAFLPSVLAKAELRLALRQEASA